MTDTEATYKARARVLKALAHPARLFVVDELSRGERCVRDLTRLVGTKMSTVSRHLALLKDAGLLEDERRGSQVFYRLSPRGEQMRSEQLNGSIHARVPAKPASRRQT